MTGSSVQSHEPELCLSRIESTWMDVQFFTGQKSMSIVFVLWQLFLGLRIARSDLSSCGELD